MLARINGARVCAALLITFFSSTTVADVSAVSTRAELAGTDFISWPDNHAGVGDYTILYNPGNVITNKGAGLTVTQPSIGYGVLIAEPNVFGLSTSLPDGQILYHTNNPNNYPNVISFSNFDGLDVCALGTQIAPVETGTYTARIEAFNLSGSLGSFPFTGATNNPDALFVGIANTEPMTSVEVSIVNAGSGSYNAYYAINQVDLRACANDVPTFTCEGFSAPMDGDYPVKSKKNRVFPLKMELFDEDGFALTDLNLTAAPVVEVMYTSSAGGYPVEPPGDLLPVGKASEGNQFLFEDGIWQFKLSSKGYSAAGTYLVTAVSGDESEYVIDPSCVTSFVRQ